MLIFFLVISSLLSVSAITSNSTPSKPLTVTFLDVGQADSILIQTPDNKNILVDGGNKDDSKKIIDNLKKNKINTLEVIVGTHPDEDHIGGLADVLKSIKVNKIYMPKVASNTKTFETLLETIKSKKLKVTSPKAGEKVIETKDLVLQILAPNSTTYDEKNEHSIVMKLTYKGTSFMFTGDAEAVSEKEMLAKKYNLKADVLKVGHHGGSTSTSKEFLKVISPKYAVISVGEGNNYGHPTDGVIDRLKGVQVYRTDLNGTITAISDGKTISFKTEKNEIPKETNNNSAALGSVVYITNTGQKYHLGTCSSLKSSKIEINLKEAKERGYEPCQICNPPK